MTKYRTQTKYRSYTIKECIDWTRLDDLACRHD